MQFLMGLNDNFKPVRGQILLMKPLPCAEDAYSMIQQEERQMDMSQFVYNDGISIALLSGRSNPHQRTWNTNSSGQKTWNQNNQTDKRELYCQHCQRTGHVQEKCFKLHGFPANYKPRGEPNSNTFQRNNNSGSGGHMAHHMTASNTSPINHASAHTNNDQSSPAQINIASASPQPSPQLTPD
ncbi:hypothetical protein BUALT_Bualt10G0099100 [Buddleja alternifolia]|uniref:Uncharacterized protein n=1 Tax=Buddleja alternifolia TaxID=168488 RepID=A0AAV6WZ68_9LAMI|nr:hypothetical protein BUALT_Bualt10G0099100 [Buddleja alternifolia]